MALDSFQRLRSIETAGNPLDCSNEKPPCSNEPEKPKTVTPCFHCQIGSPIHTLGEHSEPHVKIELFANQHRRISKNFIEMNLQGRSLDDISKQTGKAKNTIRDYLKRYGVDLRPKLSEPIHKVWKKPGKRNIRPYYGFCYFQGSIVPDPREYENLLFIHSLWKQEQNPNAIAGRLNDRKIPARSAQCWNRNSIVLILDRFKNGVIKLEGTKFELK
jgi:hypothetical protein